MTGRTKVKSEKRIGRTARSYLILYNLLQCTGWTYLMYMIIENYCTEPTVSSFKLWRKVSFIVKVFETTALLEITHAIANIVPSSVILTAFQLFSRVFVVWGVLHSIPVSQESVGVPLILLAWTITEIIRYLYYFLNLIGSMPYLLKWCRYTFFIVLYPLGVTGELLCLYKGMPYISKTDMYSILLPNKLNFTFSFYYFLWFIMASYIPVFPRLYLHMLAQRKKVLSDVVVEKKD